LVGPQQPARCSEEWVTALQAAENRHGSQRIYFSIFCCQYLMTVGLSAASNAVAQPDSILAITGSEQDVLPNGLVLQ
jgi:hypothetical protein